MKCPKCNYDNADNNNYCERCGQSLNYKQAYCPQCGKELKQNETYCPNCGNKLNNSNNYTNTKKIFILSSIVIVVALLTFASLISYNNNEVTPKDDNATIIEESNNENNNHNINKKKRFKREANQIFLIEEITETKNGKETKYSNQQLLGYVDKVFKSPDIIKNNNSCDKQNYAGMVTEKYDLNGNGTKDKIKMYQTTEHLSPNRHKASDIEIELSNGQKSTLNLAANFVCILHSRQNGVNDILITGECEDSVYYEYYKWNGNFYNNVDNYEVPVINLNDIVFTTIKDSIGMKMANGDTMYVVARVDKPIDGNQLLINNILKWEISLFESNSNQKIEDVIHNYVRKSWKDFTELNDVNNPMDGRYYSQFTITKKYEDDYIITLWSNVFVVDGGVRASVCDNNYASFNKKTKSILGLEIFKANTWKDIKPLLLNEVKEYVEFRESNIKTIPEPQSIYIANDKIYFNYKSIYDIDPNFVGPGYWATGFAINISISAVKKYITPEFQNSLIDNN